MAPEARTDRTVSNIPQRPGIAIATVRKRPWMLLQWSPAASGGWIEIPDCLPVVGNLDEVAVTPLLLRCLERVGFPVLPRQG